MRKVCVISNSGVNLTDTTEKEQIIDPSELRSESFKFSITYGLKKHH